MCRFTAIGITVTAVFVGNTVCAQEKPPFVGQKRWVKPGISLLVCEHPSRVGKNDWGKCREIQSGSFIVMRSITSEFGIPSGHMVKFEDGKVEFAISLVLTETEAEHQKSITAKAECDRRGGVSVGMTREQVYASCWGKPRTINLTRTAAGDSE